MKFYKIVPLFRPSYSPLGVWGNIIHNYDLPFSLEGLWKMSLNLLEQFWRSGKYELFTDTRRRINGDKNRSLEFISGELRLNGHRFQNKIHIKALCSCHHCPTYESYIQIVLCFLLFFNQLNIASSFLFHNTWNTYQNNDDASTAICMGTLKQNKRMDDNPRSSSSSDRTEVNIQITIYKIENSFTILFSHSL